MTIFSMFLLMELLQLMDVI